MIDPGSLWCSADSLALGTTMVPSMESWDHKRDEQFASTSKLIIRPRTALDENKVRSNATKHGVTFDAASTVSLKSLSSS